MADENGRGERGPNTATVASMSAAAAGGVVGSSAPNAKKWPRGRLNRLHWYAGQGDPLGIASELKSRRYDINMISEGKNGLTALMYAIGSGVLSAVKVLLDNGADVSVVGDEGVTALVVCAEFGRAEAAEMLIEAGSDIETKLMDGDRPLHVAAHNKHTGVMTVLVNAGAEVNSRGNEGLTPLFISAKMGNRCAVEMLLRAGADPTLTVFMDHGRAKKEVVPLDLAVGYDKIEVVREFLRWGGIDKCGGKSHGGNALEFATEKENVGIMSLLLNAGVVENGAVLGYASEKGRPLSVKFLLQQRQGKSDEGRLYVDSTYDVRGRTPLERCALATKSCCKTAQMLIAHGADATPVILRVDKLFEAVESIRAGNFHLTEECRLKMEGIRRLLLRAEAIRALSWAWPGAAKGVVAVRATDTPPRRILPIMRRRACRPKVLLAALIRYNGKLDAPFLGDSLNEQDTTVREILG